MKPIISIAVIGLCIGAYFMYIKPLTVDVRLLGVEKSKYDNVLNRVQKITDKRDEILADYESIPAEDIDRLKKIIPDKIVGTSLLNDLSVIGARYGIVIKDFKLTELDSLNREVIDPNTSTGYKTTMINFAVNGRYAQFLSFLDEVESSLTLIDIVNLSAKAGTARDGKASEVMDFTLEAHTYSLK